MCFLVFAVCSQQDNESPLTLMIKVLKRDEPRCLSAVRTLVQRGALPRGIQVSLFCFTVDISSPANA